MRDMSNPAATDLTAAASAPLREFVTSSTRRPGDVQCPVLAALFLPARAARCNHGEGRTCGECAARRASGAQLGLPGVAS